MCYFAANVCSSAPSKPTEGTVSFSDSDDHDSIGTFACNSGFFLSGDATVTCDATTNGAAWPSAANPTKCTGDFFLAS